MAAIEKSGYLKINIELVKQGPLTKEESDEAQKAIIDAIKKLDLEIKGRFSFIQIDTLELGYND